MNKYVEYIEILTSNLGLSGDVNELIKAHQHAQGDFAYCQKTKQEHREIWIPEAKRLRGLLSTKILALFPEYKGYEWVYGRLDYSECYITIYNPDFYSNEKVEDCLFPDDFIDELEQLGAKRIEIYGIISDLHAKSKLRILDYYNYVRDDEYNSQILELYVEKQYKHFKESK